MEIIRVGLIGLGKFGALESEILYNLPGVELEAFSSQSQPRLEELGRRFGVKRLYTNYKELLTRKEIDAVFITSESKWHAKQAMTALECDKHVFVEKPLALSYEEGRAVVKAAKEKGLLLMVGFLLRFDQKILCLKEFIDEGKLGPLVYMSFHRSCSKSLFEGSRYVDPVQETMVHDVDLALWFAQSKVIKVSALQMGASKNNKPRAYLAILTFKNGIGVTLETDWLVPNAAPINILEGDRTVNSYFKVVGENGRAEVNFLNDGLIMWSNNEVLHPLTGLRDKIGGQIQGAIALELKHFIECIRHGVPSPIASVEDSLHGLKIGAAILEAASNNEEISL